MKNAASTFCTNNQSLIADIRRGMGFMEDVAVDLEKDQRFDMVKELEDAVVELGGISEHSAYFSSAVESVANRCQPGEEVVDRVSRACAGL